MGKGKVMIIGAGPGQVPIIKCCKKHGYETLIVSPGGPYPGIDIADLHIKEDIYNVDKIIGIAKEENINYVISDQSDYAVPIVAKISSALNLPGNPVEVAETYTFKNKFREFCKKNHIPTPKAITIKKDFDSKEIEKLKFPLIVKPADSQGSRGIKKIYDKDSLDTAIKEALHYSKTGKVIIEEFFRGKEIVCEGFVLNGEYYNVAFGDREYFNLKDKFIPSKTIFPSSIEGYIKEKIIQNEKKITSILKPNFGIIHSEYIITENGDFIVVESALRGGGVYIASHLIPFTTDIDLTEVLYNAMVGNDEKAHKILKDKKEDKVAEYLCFYLNEGTVTNIKKENINKIPDVKLVEIDNINIGDKISKFEHKGQRKGPIIIVSSNFQELKSSENQIKEHLKIEIDGTMGVNWE